MNKEGTTAHLQHWMKEVITTHGTLQHKLQKAKGLYAIDEHDVVTSNEGASIYRRLNVYTTGYILRLLECLSVDFPVLKAFVGDEVFDSFAKASLVWSPPTSYTLYDLGNNFIRFLEDTRPQSAGEMNAMLDLPIELAKLERARQEAIRANGTEGDDTVAQINIEDVLWQPHSMVIKTPECVRLLDLKFPLKTFFEKVSKDEEYEIPEPQPAFIAVSRKHYCLVMEDIEQWQYAFLNACNEPVNLMTAIEVTAQHTGISTSQLMADLYIWLPVFYEKGFLVRR